MRVVQATRACSLSLSLACAAPSGPQRGTLQWRQSVMYPGPVKGNVKGNPGVPPLRLKPAVRVNASGNSLYFGAYVDLLTDLFFPAETHVTRPLAPEIVACCSKFHET